MHSFILLSALASSELVNITVDDQLGDPITGMGPQYSPLDDVWNIGSPTENCTACHIQPEILDLNRIYGKTWHDATPLNSTMPTTITFHFTGSAVYVFNILLNRPLDPTTVTLANITFSIDGISPSAFTRHPDLNGTTTILYNQLVYQNTALNNGPHTLTMTVGPVSLILFDYLIYTMQSNDTTSLAGSTASVSINSSQRSSEPTAPVSTQSASSSTPVGSIAGGVVGGVVILFGVAFGAFLLGRRNTHSNPAQPRQSYGAFPGTRPVNPDATSPSITRGFYGVETHNLLDITSEVSGQFAPRSSPVVADGAVTVGRSSKRRSELTRRIEALQRTRSVLSSQPPSGPSRSQFSSERGTDTTIWELEAEIAELRGELAALNVQFADRSRDEHSEPLPEYSE